MKFTKALARVPSPELIHGLTSSDLGEPDYKTTMIQFEAYLKVFHDLGVEVGVLAANNHYPDSCFVEDVALCVPGCGIVTRPGATSRRGEIEGMDDTLGEYFDSVEKIGAPGTLDGGDVMMVGNHYYIGLSDRTNEAGAQALIEVLEKHGFTGSTVVVQEEVHLKSGVSYLENGNLLAIEAYWNEPQFQQFNLIKVEKEEAYAANVIWVNDTVIVPEGFPTTLERIQAAGYATVTVPMSEFQKVDGGLSCLSLRF